MSAQVRDRLFRYCFALFCTAFAAWMRHLCEPTLQGRLPLGFFTLAVALTCWLAGPAPAMLSLILGAIAAAQVAIPPSNSFWIEDPADWMALGVYLVAGVVIIALFHRLASQQQVATQSAGENAQLVKNLLVADRRKHDYLALLAHELRNPLAPLHTGLEILRRGGGPDDPSKLLNVMSRQLDHITRLLDDLLDVTRFAKGQIRFHRQVLDLRCAAKTAAEAILPHVEACEHQFECRVPEIPIWIRGDRVRLVQIITNLLSNAAKYTPHGGHIVMSLVQRNGHAELSVRDNGFGIAREDQKRIFELFEQMDSSPQRDAEGLGIGLSLVQHLVRAHNGSIEVCSEGAGKGATFTVRIPLLDRNHMPRVTSAQPICDPEPAATSEPTPAAAAASPAASLSSTPARSGPQRVLIVDDNRDVAETMAALLSFEGMHVETANDGLAALQTAERFVPDIILLDIGMPGMDGFEVAREIRSRNLVQPRILAVSGWGGEECERMAREAGIDEHWLKPIDAAALVNRLGEFHDTSHEPSAGAAAAATPAAASK